MVLGWLHVSVNTALVQWLEHPYLVQNLLQWNIGPRHYMDHQDKSLWGWWDYLSLRSFVCLWWKKVCHSQHPALIINFEEEETWNMITWCKEIHCYGCGRVSDHAYPEKEYCCPSVDQDNLKDEEEIPCESGLVWYFAWALRFYNLIHHGLK